MSVEQWWNDTGTKTAVFAGNCVPVLPPQVPHGIVVWD